MKPRIDHVPEMDEIARRTIEVVTLDAYNCQRELLEAKARENIFETALGVTAWAAVFSLPEPYFILAPMLCFWCTLALGDEKRRHRLSILRKYQVIP